MCDLYGKDSLYVLVPPLHIAVELQQRAARTSVHPFSSSTLADERTHPNFILMPSSGGLCALFHVQIPSRCPSSFRAPNRVCVGSATRPSLPSGRRANAPASSVEMGRSRRAARRDRERWAGEKKGRALTRSERSGMVDGSATMLSEQAHLAAGRAEEAEGRGGSQRDGPVRRGES